MAYASTTLWDVRATGSDTLNGGSFDPGNVNFATDLTATAALTNSPVCSSSSYVFAVSDIGAWLFIQRGTNWIPGWYKITAIAGSSAVVSAAVGAGYLLAGNIPGTPTTTTGCATSNAVSGGVWSIDYSQQDAAAFTFTDLIVGATNTQLTSAANPFGKNHVGNMLVQTSGSGFTLTRFQITSVTGTTATCDSSVGTASSTGGHAGLGGGLASPAIVAGIHTASNAIAIQGTFTFSNSVNVSGGRFSSTTASSAVAPLKLFGYSTNRCWLNTDTPPICQPGAGGVTTMWYFGGNYVHARNISITNPNSYTTGIAFANDANSHVAQNISVSGTWYTGLRATSPNIIWENCKVTLTAGVGTCYALASSMKLYRCDAFNGNIGFSVGTQSNVTLKQCTAANQSGSSASGIQYAGGTGNSYDACNVYNVTGSGAGGIVANGDTQSLSLITNCCVTDCAGVGYSNNATLTSTCCMFNNAGYNNSGGNTDAGFNSAINNTGFIALTASPWNNPGSLDFSKNSTPGGGALLRGVGYPATFPGVTGTSYSDIGAFQGAVSGVSTNATAPQCLRNNTYFYIG